MSAIIRLLIRSTPLLLLFSPLSVNTAVASEGNMDFTGSPLGIIAVLVFIAAYAMVIGEEFWHLRKSKPMIVAAGIIWLLTGIVYYNAGDTQTAGEAVEHYILEYAELFLFLLAAMTFITTLEERRLFDSLRAWLVTRNFTLRQIYWVTGSCAFTLSLIEDNLSCSLLMGAVLLAVGNHYKNFVVAGCINIVVASNAGGASSPFGDITSLIVWQAGMVPIEAFPKLFVPALVTWLIPAFMMSFSIENEAPVGSRSHLRVKKGALVIAGIFLATILSAVLSHSILNLPPVLAMMTGLGVMKIYCYFLERHEPIMGDQGHIANHHDETIGPSHEHLGDNVDIIQRFNIFRVVERASWDTLMFFYGVVLCVGGLATLGYLAVLSDWLYTDLGPTYANILIGIASALVDNIPVMFAVLSMQPDMSLNQWLLATLAAGVGGSMLSIGSAAGIALMGQAQGMYTFMAHLRWSWVIAIGYAGGITTHILINGT